MDDTNNQTQLTFLDTQLTLVNRKTNDIKYLFDLPFDVRRDFCNLLDADKSWRELGSQKSSNQFMNDFNEIFKKKLMNFFFNRW